MYSQNDEQTHIVTHFAGRVGKFLDIGAYDGKKYSNVRRLLELGWSGFLVEPAPSVIPLLKANVEEFGARAKVLTCAVGAKHDDAIEFFDNAGAVATTSRAHVQKWSKKEKFEPCKVTQITPAELLDITTTSLDFINIDVESANIDVVRSMPWHRLPGVTLICVEHDRHQLEMMKIVGEFGFKKITENPENLILAR